SAGGCAARGPASVYKFPALRIESLRLRGVIAAHGAARPDDPENATPGRQIMENQDAPGAPTRTAVPRPGGGRCKPAGGQAGPEEDRGMRFGHAFAAPLPACCAGAAAAQDTDPYCSHRRLEQTRRPIN